MIIEDKEFGGNKPYIDLTPLNSWGPNLAKHIGKENWISIEKHVCERVNYTCELCSASPKTAGIMGKKANKFTIELRFEHNEATKIATLRRLINVCVPCYQAIHIRQTELMSRHMQKERSPLIGAIARLCIFHNLTDIEVEQWKDKELQLWNNRQNNSYPENLNIDIIEDGTNRLWSNVIY